MLMGKRKVIHGSFLSISAKYFLLPLGFRYDENILAGLLTSPQIAPAYYFPFGSQTQNPIVERTQIRVGGYADICSSSLLAIKAPGSEPGMNGTHNPGLLTTAGPISCLSFSFACFILCFLLRICIDFVEPLQQVVNDAFNEKSLPGALREHKQRGAIMAGH